MRQISFVLLATAVLAGLATAASAAVTFNFEDQAYGNPLTVTSTVSGVTVTITRADGGPVSVQGPLGPASWMGHSLLGYPNGSPPGLIANLSALASAASIQFGDYNADSDTGWLTAYSGLNGTGTVLGTNSLFYPGSMNITAGDSNVGTLSVSASGIQSIVFTSSGEYPDSVYWDNLVVETSAINPTVPEPSTIIVWSLLGSLAIGLGWWRKRKAAHAAIA